MNAVIDVCYSCLSVVTVTIVVIVVVDNVANIGGNADVYDHELIMMFSYTADTNIVVFLYFSSLFTCLVI